MNRRGFLNGILATAIAPAIVRSESLMKIWVPSQEIVVADNMAMMHAREIERALFFGTPTGPRYALVGPQMYRQIFGLLEQ
jgi:hypothetical protein